MKALVVLSGGMDSATALAVAIRDHGAENVESVTYNYGSKHNAQENRFAKLLSSYYGVKNTLIDMLFINQYFKSDLLLSGGEIPEGHYEDPSMKKTVVPFRNGIMLSISAGLAESIAANKLYIGNHAGDHAIYPDCRTQFIIPMQQAIVNGTYERVELCSPFCHSTKADIAILGKTLRVPYELTYSCYKGQKHHCGRCGTCFERKEAFQNAAMTDPTVYE